MINILYSNQNYKSVFEKIFLLPYIARGTHLLVSLILKMVGVLIGR